MPILSSSDEIEFFRRMASFAEAMLEGTGGNGKNKVKGGLSESGLIHP